MRKPVKPPPERDSAKQPLFRKAAKRSVSADSGVGSRAKLRTFPLHQLFEAVRQMFPEEARKHARLAHRQQLLAWRVLIDARLAELYRRDKDSVM